MGLRKLIQILCSVLFLQICAASLLAEESSTALPTNTALPTKSLRTLRIGHFPNLTHAVALEAHARWRNSPADFEAQLGNNIKVEWYTYNAGPQAMEALLAGSIDLAYVGPNPAINAFVRSKGEELCILAGATFGGSALVVQGNAEIRTLNDFRGRRIGTPHLGNTQDVAARTWFLDHGFNISIGGGDVQIIAAENPELLTLFSSKQLDGAWTVEPWVSRLEREAGAKIFVRDDSSITTVLVASTKLLASNADLVSAFLKVHSDLTVWVTEHPNQAKLDISNELKAETSRAIEPEIVNQAWSRMKFSKDLTKSDLDLFLSSAKRVGFLKEVAEISKILNCSESRGEALH